MRATPSKAPAPPALAGASQQARQLIEQLKGEAGVTLEQLETLLPEDLSADEMDEIFVVLAESGVAIVKARPPAQKQPAVAKATVKPRAAAPDPGPTESVAPPTRMQGVVAQYLAEIGTIPPLSAAEEESLTRMASEGDARAANALVESHLRLVVKICGEYRHTGLNRMDLIQAGNVGLMDAARHFKPGKATGRFAHYSSWWIRQAIRAHIEAAGLFIRLPRRLVKEMHALARQRARMLGQLKREATDQEVGDALGWPLEKIGYLSDLGHDPLSLDAPLPNDKEKRFEETVVDPRAPEQVLATRKRHVIASLRTHLERLSTAEKSVLTLRYGLRDQVERSVHEVSAMTSLSREEVRSLERDGLRKLADMSMASLQTPFDDDE